MDNRTRTLSVDWWHSQINSPYYYLFFGLLFLAIGLASVYSGQSPTRQGWVYRDKNPTDFWWVIGIYSVGGVCFIGYCLYKVYELSN